MKKFKIIALIGILGVSLIGCDSQGMPNNNGTSNGNVIESETVVGITPEKAKEIALNHAGLKAEDVTFVKVEKDFDNGVEEFEVAFYANGKEYDYEIDTKKGEVISYESDIQNFTIPENSVTNSQTNNTASITAEKAKEIALNHAGLKAADVTFIKVERDYDNGIEKYEVDFYANGKEYDYDINCRDGNIISYESEVENYTTPNAAVPAPTPTNPPTTNPNVTPTGISADRAKEIALNHAGATNDQVRFVKVERDYDDGVDKYELEFVYNNVEYDYEIDVNTGTILSYERD